MSDLKIIDTPDATKIALLASTIDKQAKRIAELERQLRWLKSKAFVEGRDFEKPGYHWQIHFNSTCATVDNAIKKAALKGADDV